MGFSGVGGENKIKQQAAELFQGLVLQGLVNFPFDLHSTWTNKLLNFVL